jgi:hypothetical protein
MGRRRGRRETRNRWRGNGLGRCRLKEDTRKWIRKVERIMGEGKKEVHGEGEPEG